MMSSTSLRDRTTHRQEWQDSKWIQYIGMETVTVSQVLQVTLEDACASGPHLVVSMTTELRKSVQL